MEKLTTKEQQLKDLYKELKELNELAIKEEHQNHLTNQRKAVIFWEIKALVLSPYPKIFENFEIALKNMREQGRSK